MDLLEDSIWLKIDPIESSSPTLFEVFSKEHVILNYIPLDDLKNRYQVWGGKYQDLGGGDVLVIRPGAQNWHSEQYQVVEDTIIWTTQIGTKLKYRRAGEEDIPSFVVGEREKKLLSVASFDFPTQEVNLTK